MAERIIEIRSLCIEPEYVIDYSDYERRIRLIEERGRELELRYNHNHDEKGRFCSGVGGGRAPAKNVDNSGKSGIIKAGAISGGHSPDSKEAQKHADKYYESVRKMKTDVKRIAENTGFSKEDISQIKNHVFIEEHDLGNDVPERFYPSYAMAQSWQRLIDGNNIQKHDITLLNHEKTESNLMKKGHSQEDAHRIAEKKYNYAKESREFYAKADKHNKK